MAIVFSYFTDAVTYGHIANSFLYKNTVDLVELKGRDLIQVFEQVASLYDESKPSASFLQVSGIFTLCLEERSNHMHTKRKKKNN